MNNEEHRQRHIKLHRYLDELFADWIEQNPDLDGYTNQPIKVLMEWSHKQTIEPDHPAVR